ncbi:hypothetical protein SAMN02745244_01719 [Tessaracoccus bendigoensis DSM 12906]|uniref:Uncharacterized protein n=1 Tax=Tessaracoccus bendigoensis DSM 12906 TaxID=1123357 RepID=A0A1M6GJW4_9ACTN|nr:hypothetical protein [Tessaracoccus bendigoensis]SHJ10232.1 hypothetical protein SAMN02745244_01719 [Tessaracoccus bendigoensis DSM 12906]
MALCLVGAALLVVLAVVVPADLGAIVRPLIGVCAVLLVTVTGFVLAGLRGQESPRAAPRWASLICGALAGGAVVALLPAIGDFAHPLGPTASALVQLVFGIFGLGIVAVGIWGFVRRR